MKAGVVVEAGGRRLFVSARQACAVVEAPRPAPVPGAGFSLVWFEGEVLVAVPFDACVPDRHRRASDPEPGADSDPGPPHVPGGPRRAAALICELGGRRYGLLGVGILATGRFEPVDVHPVDVHPVEPRDATEWVHHDGGAVPECVLQEPRDLVGDLDPAPAVAFRGTLSDGEASEPEDQPGSEEADGE